MMNAMAQADPKWDREHSKLRPNSSEKSRRAEDNIECCKDVRRVTEKFMQEAIDKVDGQMIYISGRTVVDSLEACAIDHNIVIIKSVLRRARNGALVYILDNSLYVRKFIENVVIHVATAPKSLPIIRLETVKDSAALALNSPYAAEIMKQKMKESVEDLFLT